LILLVAISLAGTAGCMDPSESSIEAGLRTTALGYGNLRLQVAFGPVLRNSENRLFTANAVGLHATILPGYQSDRWGLMAEVGYEKMVVTNLRHSQLYEDTYYADAESGWYSNTAGTCRRGVGAGIRVGEVNLAARVGAVATEGGAPHLPPFYGAIGTSCAF
jgi:hypothetical protein